MSFQVVREKPPTGQNWIMGQLFAGAWTFVTLELPWKNNEQKVSCIPPGVYNCAIAWSNRYKRLMPRLLHVPNRSGILIHPGNTTKDTSGCILIGTTAGPKGKIYMSQDAFTRFFDWLGMEMRNGLCECEVSYAN